MLDLLHFFKFAHPTVACESVGARGKSGAEQIWMYGTCSHRYDRAVLRKMMKYAEFEELMELVKSPESASQSSI